MVFAIYSSSLMWHISPEMNQLLTLINSPHCLGVTKFISEAEYVQLQLILQQIKMQNEIFDDSCII